MYFELTGGISDNLVPLHEHTAQATVRGITIYHEVIIPIRERENRSITKKILQSLKRFLLLGTPSKRFLFLSQRSKRNDDLGKVRDESTVITRQP
ncbi:hypothetical protein HanIR_Chr09g0409961 [Helianthus annuus]|nr:hypothetical protein HanIR_Chr09g0409961 [Helianthus annuus]